MQQQYPNRHPDHRPVHRRMTRAEQLRRRRRRAARRLLGLAAVVALMVAGGAAGFFLFRPGVPAASSESSQSSALNESVQTPISQSSSSQAAADSTENSAASQVLGPGGLTPQQAAEMLADPLLVLVNHSNPMPEDYTFETAECGSANATNKLLQTAACEAFLQMQAAAAEDGVTVWMQSGLRTVDYQAGLYQNKVQQYLNKGYDEATAKELAAGIVNPPGYSEHNCGLAADLNCPEYLSLDEGFENTAAFAWLSEHAGEYGFILRYPAGEEAFAVTEITYEPWHWRYVGPEYAALINESGLYFEQYIEMLQELAAQAQ